MALGLQRFGDFVGAGEGGKANGRPLLDADAGEELMRVELSVAIALGSRPLELPGTLYVTSRRVIWVSDSEEGKGYAVDFLSLSLHAVSRDPEAYPFPCIYTQLEVEDDDEDEEFDDSSSGDQGELELSKVSEMRLVPSDAGQLDGLFEIFCHCAELNPEPRQEGEEENSWFFGDQELADADDGCDSEWHISDNFVKSIGQTNGDHDLSHRVHELQLDPQRFEDAEEGESETHDGHQLAG